tara:strand:- start:5395 stop:5835 length:441 start_codon:yes stop_codon:yes gene_type:complete
MKAVQSYNTAMSRRGPSAPLKFLESKNLLHGNVLDYGCGKGADYKYLASRGYSSEGFDPYWEPKDLSGARFETILCTYVLNVIDKSDESDVLNKIKKLLKPGGKAYISVRRDIKKDGPTSRGFQRKVFLDLETIKSSSSYCIYCLK